MKFLTKHTDANLRTMRKLTVANKALFDNFTLRRHVAAVKNFMVTINRILI